MDINHPLSLHKAGYKSNFQQKAKITVSFSANKNVTCSNVHSEVTKLDINALQANFLTRSSKVSFGRNLKEGQENHLNYLGAHYSGNGKAIFRVYAPYAREVSLQLSKEKTLTKYWEEEKPLSCRTLPMNKVNNNVFEVNVDDVQPGNVYRFELTYPDGNKALRKDPRSFSQPEDTLGWSAVYDQNGYSWSDKDWLSGQDSRRIYHQGDKNQYGTPPGMIIEEMHIGVLGGFQKAKAEIDRIAKEGICNSVLVMPLGEYAGKYNIGYDESDKFAPESSSGTPDDLKSFVDYAHSKGINLLLDVVPNHFGLEGTVVHDFGPAFDNDNHTPWGAALNFSKKGKEYMRHYMVDMMMNWLANYHFDGLRIDASEKLFSDTTLKLISSEIRNHPETEKAVLIPEHLDKTRKLIQPLTREEIADPQKTEQESEKNPEKLKKLGFDIQYIYDFKNTLMALTSGWNIYDCPPSIKDLEKEYLQGYRYYGDCPELKNPPANANLVYMTAHDELNPYGGVRAIPRILAVKLGLTKENAITSPDGLDKKPFRKVLDLIKFYIAGNYDALAKNGISKAQFEKAYNEAKSLNRLSLGAVFMHPGQKMLFMGDQRGELAPFNYNADIPENAIYGGSEPQYKGKKLKDVLADQKGYELGEPADKESQLGQKEFTDPKLRDETLRFTKKLKELYNENASLRTGDFNKLVTYTYEKENVLHVHRFVDGNEILAVLNFNDKSFDNFELKSFPNSEWQEVLNSNDKEFGGDGNCLNLDKTISRANSSIKLPKQSITIFKKVSK